MTIATILLFSITSLAVVITPGPTMLLAMSNGASKGNRFAFFGIIGAALSDLLLIGAVSLGLGALLATSEALFSLVKWIGVSYLVWLAIQLWRSRPESLVSTLDGTQASLTPVRAFTRSLLVALSNPKGLLFFSAFLPQFVNAGIPQLSQYFVLAIVFTLLDILAMATYAFGGVQAARLLSSHGLCVLNRVCASIMLMPAGFLAVYRRSNI